jgi:hypothetical protein
MVLFSVVRPLYIKRAAILVGSVVAGAACGVLLGHAVLAVLTAVAFAIAGGVTVQPLKPDDISRGAE